MAWNRGSDGAAPVKAKAKPSPVRGVIAGAVVVILAVVAYFAFFSSSEKPKNDEVGKKPAKIKEGTPAAAPTNQPPPRGTVTAAEKPFPPPGAYQDEHGVWRNPGGTRCFDPRCRERAVKSPTKSNIPKFRHAVEREIATLLTATPGMPLVGMPHYSQMQQDFANAVVDKIEISEEDSERDREIKQQVIDAKKDLVERVKAGEDLVTILKESRAEIQRLASYKKEIQALVNEQLRDASKSDADVDAVFEAANKMLESKGIAPIKSGLIMRRRGQILINEARRKEKAEAAKSAQTAK